MPVVDAGGRPRAEQGGVLGCPEGDERAGHAKGPDWIPGGVGLTPRGSRLQSRGERDLRQAVGGLVQQLGSGSVPRAGGVRENP